MSTRQEAEEGDMKLRPRTGGSGSSRSMDTEEKTSTKRRIMIRGGRGDLSQGGPIPGRGWGNGKGAFPAADQNGWMRLGCD